jgi:hypothetical protein
MYVIPPQNAGQFFSAEFAKVINPDTWLEDFSTLESTQEVLGSGAKDHFVLQDEEICVRHFYKTLDEWPTAKKSSGVSRQKISSASLRNASILSAGATGTASTSRFGW